MLKSEKTQSNPGSDSSLATGASLLDGGHGLAGLFRGAIVRATGLLASLTTTNQPPLVDMDSIRQVVDRAAPYLGATQRGTIYYTPALHEAASTIQRALYDIPPARGTEDYQQRIKSHHAFIDDTIWKPLTGKLFLETVRDHFQREGIHCHTPEALARESELFVSAVTHGDISRFSTFLMWCLKDDPELINKIIPRLG